MINATKKDIDFLKEILSTAFVDNKSVNYLIPKGKKQHFRINSLMEYSILECLDFGQVLISDDRKACALVMFPDFKCFTFASFYRDVKLIFNLGISNALKGMRREAMVKQWQPAGYLYYLWFIGVHPNNQGKGSGTRLLSALIADAQRSGRELCLETSTEVNMPWYLKNGFKTYEALNFGYNLYFLKLI
jgi:GNAT superfamily N-acetyltransferase